LTCAAIWVALEMIVSRLFGGFPWNLLGNSQYHDVPLIQLASLTGVCGISFLVAWTSLSFLCAAAVILNRPNLRSIWMGEIILPFTAVAAAFVFGILHLRETPAATRGLDVTLVQPSIPQTLIWDPNTADDRFQDLLRLTERALTNHTDLLIWPEAAIPKLLRYDEATFSAVTNIAIKHHVWMIVGSDDAEPSKTSNDPKDADYFNSSFLVSPDGRLAAHYQKRQLVIFGEYIPLVRWLPFIKWFTPIQGSFAEGKRIAPFEFTFDSTGVSPGTPDQLVKTAVLICYEDTFAPLAREATGSDTDFLVNITNDGWFGEGAEQQQQAATALFRTVENGVPLIRCTNNGLTCWYDANGRLREFFTDARGTIYGPGYLTIRVPLLSGQRRAPTFYHDHGDWFGWACVGYVVLALIRARFGRKSLGV
jgi:apolipoprotein N-acyltransferase